MTDLEQIIMEVQREHREMLTERGRTRAPRGTKRAPTQRRHLTYEYQGKPISLHELAAQTGIAKSTLVSRAKSGVAGSDLSRRPTRHKQIDTALLWQCVREGREIQHIAAQIGMSESSTRFTLRRHGMYRRWQRARYRKCK